MNLPFAAATGPASAAAQAAYATRGNSSPIYALIFQRNMQ